MQTFVDHLVVTARCLASGAAFIREALGVEMQPGGAHPRMATHNRLLSLGDTTYLEVIAPDPSALKPNRPRWFELDRLADQAKPRLATWIARTTDISTASTSSSALGAIEPMSRNDLSWLITVAKDGSLPLGGAVPELIEWQSSPHPAARLKNAGCTLHALQIYHPAPLEVQDVLAAINLSGPVQVHRLPPGSPPRLHAQIETPAGLRTL